MHVSHYCWLIPSITTPCHTIDEHLAVQRERIPGQPNISIHFLCSWLYCIYYLCIYIDMPVLTVISSPAPPHCRAQTRDDARCVNSIAYVCKVPCYGQVIIITAYAPYFFNIVSKDYDIKLLLTLTICKLRVYQRRENYHYKLEM